MQSKEKSRDVFSSCSVIFCQGIIAAFTKQRTSYCQVPDVVINLSDRS